MVKSKLLTDHTKNNLNRKFLRVEQYLFLGIAVLIWPIVSLWERLTGQRDRLERG